LRYWLIVSQVAASVLVLITAGLFVRGFQKAHAADPGFDTSHLLTVDLDMRQMKYPPERMARFYDQLRSSAAGLPGVVSYSYANVLPLGNTRVVTIPGVGEIATATVDSNYFRTMAIPIVRGRQSERDESNVVIVNAALASRLWPNQDPVGKSVELGSKRVRHQVIAVTATGKYWSLSEPDRPFLYRISHQHAEPILCLAIRTAGPVEGLAAQITKEIRRLEPALAGIRIQTEKERLRAWFEPQRAAAVLLSILGMAALGLAITGLYALLVHVVAQRTPEIAVRVTLGASPATIAAMLLRRSASLILAGTAAGVAASAVIARLLASLSGEASPLDGITVLCVSALIVTVGAIATLVPVYRALAIDPVDALRAE
jgi:predicted permease